MYLYAIGWSVLAVVFFILYYKFGATARGEWLMLWIPAYGSAIAAVATFIFDLSLKWQLLCAAIPMIGMILFVLFLMWGMRGGGRWN